MHLGNLVFDLVLNSIFFVNSLAAYCTLKYFYFVGKPFFVQAIIKPTLWYQNEWLENKFDLY